MVPVFINIPTYGERGDMITTVKGYADAVVRLGINYALAYYLGDGVVSLELFSVLVLADVLIKVCILERKK